MEVIVRGVAIRFANALAGVAREKADWELALEKECQRSK